MRIVCLHGVGSSGSICESQFEPFIKAADPSYEFVFIDGPAASVRGPGMGSQFSGPFYSHTEGYSPSQMKDALKHLGEVLEELGPFDGIIGFSQGAALATSFMYDQLTQHGGIPFKFALLFSTVCAFSPCQDFCRVEIEGLGAQGVKIAASGTDESASSRERILYETLTNVIKPLKDGHALLPDIDLDAYFEDPLVAPRLLVPELMGPKLSLPTFHMHGKRDADFMRRMSLIARDMYDRKRMKTLEHSGTHHPPQKDSEVKAAVRALEWVIAESRKMG